MRSVAVCAIRPAVAAAAVCGVQARAFTSGTGSSGSLGERDWKQGKGMGSKPQATTEQWKQGKSFEQGKQLEQGKQFEQDNAFEKKSFGQQDKSWKSEAESAQQPAGAQQWKKDQKPGQLAGERSFGQQGKGATMTQTGGKAQQGERAFGAGKANTTPGSIGSEQKRYFSGKSDWERGAQQGKGLKDKPEQQDGESLSQMSGKQGWQQPKQQQQQSGLQREGQAQWQKDGAQYQATSSWKKDEGRMGQRDANQEAGNDVTGMTSDLLSTSGGKQGSQQYSSGADEQKRFSSTFGAAREGSGKQPKEGAFGQPRKQDASFETKDQDCGRSCEKQSTQQQGKQQGWTSESKPQEQQQWQKDDKFGGERKFGGDKSSATTQTSGKSQFGSDAQFGNKASGKSQFGGEAAKGSEQKRYCSTYSAAQRPAGAVSGYNPYLVGAAAVAIPVGVTWAYGRYHDKLYPARTQAAADVIRRTDNGGRGL